MSFNSSPFPRFSLYDTILLDRLSNGIFANFLYYKVFVVFPIFATKCGFCQMLLHFLSVGFLILFCGFLFNNAFKSIEDVYKVSEDSQFSNSSTLRRSSGYVFCFVVWCSFLLTFSGLIFPLTNGNRALDVNSYSFYWKGFDPWIISLNNMTFCTLKLD